MRLEMRERIEGGLEITQQTILDARELLAYKDGPIIPIMLAMETVRRETRYRPRTLFVTKAELESIADSDAYRSIVKYTGPLDSDPEDPEVLARILNLQRVVIEEPGRRFDEIVHP